MKNNNFNIFVLLCSGEGTRLKGYDIPKQFIKIKKIPIFLYPLKIVENVTEIHEIAIICKKEWMNFIRHQLSKHNFKKNISLYEGGHSRNQTVLNYLNSLKKESRNHSEINLIIHDSVRIFINPNIIINNITSLNDFDCVDTAINSIDTIVVSNDKTHIDDIPNRDVLFNGQTPQSAKFSVLWDSYQKHKNDDDFHKTCVCGIVSKNKNNKIGIVKGDVKNFKITTEFDLLVARSLIHGKKF